MSQNFDLEIRGALAIILRLFLSTFFLVIIWIGVGLPFQLLLYPFIGDDSGVVYIFTMIIGAFLGISLGFGLFLKKDDKGKNNERI